VGLAINEIKAGMTLLINAQVFVSLACQHVKPGKGAAFVRVKLRNLKTGNVLERTFRGDEKAESAYVEERKLQFSYSSGDLYHFMDQQSFEEIVISKNILADKIKFLKDNLDVAAQFYKDEPLNINLPNFIVFEITDTEPGIRGDTAKGGTKPAKIETGASIQVPLFVNKGDKIKLDTRTGSYVERIY